MPGTELAAVGGNHRSNRLAIRFHTGYLGIGNNLSATTFDKIHQNVGQLHGRSLETVMAVDVETVDQGEDVCRRVPDGASAQTTHIAQQSSQFRIPYVSGHQLV